MAAICHGQKIKASASEREGASKRATHPPREALTRK